MEENIQIKNQEIMKYVPKQTGSLYKKVRNKTHTLKN